MSIYLRGNIIKKKGEAKNAWVHKVSSYGIHVVWEGGTFQVFHFKPAHHTQSNIEEIELVAESSTLKNVEDWLAGTEIFSIQVLAVTLDKKAHVNPVNFNLCQ